MTTFTSSQDGSDIDALIRITSGTSNYGTYDQLWIGEPNDDASATARSLIQCSEITNPALLPSSAIIQSVKLAILQIDDKANNASTFSIYRITASWTETGVTWNNQPAHDGTVLATRDFASNEANGSKEFTFNADGIAAVQGWVNGGYTNYGIKAISDGVDNQFRFASAENGTASNRPKWTIEYAEAGRFIIFSD
jgi:hypothetical protein